MNGKLCSSFSHFYSLCTLGSLQSKQETIRGLTWFQMRLKVNGILQAEAIWVRSALFSAKGANLTACKTSRPQLSFSRAAKVFGRRQKRKALPQIQTKLGWVSRRLFFFFVLVNRLAVLSATGKLRHARIARGSWKKRD